MLGRQDGRRVNNKFDQKMKRRNRNKTMPEAIENLLDELCIDMGFCVPPDDKIRLCSAEQWDADGFTDAIFRAEGMTFVEDLGLRRQVRRKFTDRFGASIDRTTFQMKQEIKE